MMERESYGAVTMALMLGAVVGSVVVLLYAPAAGAVTRHRLATAPARLRGDSKEKYAQARDYLVEKIDQGKTYLQDRTEAVGAAVSAGKEAYQAAKAQH